MVGHIPTHFSEVIRDQFQNRAVKNPSYSLRAFARDLGLTSGTLSDILMKKKGVSSKKASALAEKLGLESEEQEFFCKLVEANCSRTNEKRKSAESKLWKYNTNYISVSDDYYEIMSEWYHFAIVELVRVKGFKGDNDWIAKRLGISENEVRLAIERLINIGLLEVTNGKLCQTYDYFVVPSGVPSDAVKKFHKQILAKASEAIYAQKVEERDFSSGFLRVRTADLPMIAAEIKEFKRELSKKIESGDGHDSVYAFAIQFFRGDQQISRTTK